MGILPIGFFSPLPLAMMIPFMATQSLAMGEAFGKSFQYGKRKISSMSNEEFNRLTFHDLMVEQTANISALIPELKQQMAMSQDMQRAIFQEMINLIPAFFESFKKVLPTDLVETTNTVQASPPPAITEIRYAGRTEQDLAEQQAKIDALEKLIQDNFFKQQGSKQDLIDKGVAEQLAANKRALAEAEALRQAEIQKQLRTTIIHTVSTPKETKEGAEWNAWRLHLTNVQKAWIISRDGQLHFAKLNKTASQRQKASNSTQIARHARARKLHATEIKRISQDYRNPNPLIQKSVISLRKEIASGEWSTQ